MISRAHAASIVALLTWSSVNLPSHAQKDLIDSFANGSGEEAEGRFAALADLTATRPPVPGQGTAPCSQFCTANLLLDEKYAAHSWDEMGAEVRRDWEALGLSEALWKASGPLQAWRPLWGNMTSTQKAAAAGLNYNEQSWDIGVENNTQCIFCESTMPLQMISSSGSPLAAPPRGPVVEAEGRFVITCTPGDACWVMATADGRPTATERYSAIGKLTPPPSSKDIADWEGFGSSAALFVGETAQLLAIGCPSKGGEGRGGTVFVFSLFDLAAPPVLIAAPDAAASFGWAMVFAMPSDGMLEEEEMLGKERLYIGCPQCEGGRGHVYSYGMDGRDGAWRLVLELTEATSLRERYEYANFGYSLSSAAEHVVVGAPGRAVPVPPDARRTTKLKEALHEGRITGGAYLFLGAVPGDEERNKVVVPLLPGPAALNFANNDDINIESGVGFHQGAPDYHGAQVTMVRYEPEGFLELFSDTVLLVAVAAPGQGLVFTNMYVDNSEEISPALFQILDLGQFEPALNIQPWGRGNGIVWDVTSKGIIKPLPPVGPQGDQYDSPGEPWLVHGVGDNAPSQGPEDNRLSVELGFGASMYVGRRDLGINLYTTITYTVIGDIAPVFSAETLEVAQVQRAIALWLDALPAQGIPDEGTVAWCLFEGTCKTTFKVMPPAGDEAGGIGAYFAVAPVNTADAGGCRDILYSDIPVGKIDWSRKCMDLVVIGSAAGGETAVGMSFSPAVVPLASPAPPPSPRQEVHPHPAPPSPALTSADHSPPPPPLSSSPPTAVIAGAAAGAGVLLAVCAAVAYCKYRGKRFRVRIFDSREYIPRKEGDVEKGARETASAVTNAGGHTVKSDRRSSASSRGQVPLNPNMADYSLEGTGTRPASLRNAPSVKSYMSSVKSYMSSDYQSSIAMQYSIVDVAFDELKFQRRLGAGSSKTVHEALWGHNLVAVCEVTQEMIGHEVAIMASLSRHPNLVQIFGLARDDAEKKMYLVMELLSHGSLIHVLHKKANELSIMKKATLAGQICDGMVALASAKIVHADLACRNVLVQSLDPLVVKVGDFGLSKTSMLYYAENHDKIPYRWSAPEVIEKGKFSEKSDVWAFGVTLWEIYTNGKIPYGFGLTNKEVVSLVSGGGHLERPEVGDRSGDCMPDVIWSILQDCFKFHEADRPSFKDLQERIRCYQQDCMPAETLQGKGSHGPWSSQLQIYNRQSVSTTVSNSQDTFGTQSFDFSQQPAPATVGFSADIDTMDTAIDPLAGSRSTIIRDSPINSPSGSRSSPETEKQSSPAVPGQPTEWATRGRADVLESSPAVPGQPPEWATRVVPAARPSEGADSKASRASGLNSAYF